MGFNPLISINGRCTKSPPLFLMLLEVPPPPQEGLLSPMTGAPHIIPPLQPDLSAKIAAHMSPNYHSFRNHPTVPRIYRGNLPTTLCPTLHTPHPITARINTLSPEQNGHHLTHSVFKCILEDESKFCILIQIPSRVKLTISQYWFG